MRLTLPLCMLCLGAVILSGCVEKVAEQPSGPPPGGEMINKPAPQPTMGGGAGGQAKLTLFTWTEVDELEVNKRLCKDFEAENPNVKVDVINVSGSKDAMQKLETMFATKAGPDVMSIHGAYYVGFAEAGALMDLEQLAKDDSDFRLDDIHPRLVDLCRYQGKLYSLPRYTSVYALFYNKAMFDAAGLPYPGTGEWTWQKYLEAAKKLTKDLNGDGTPDEWGCTIDFWGARLYPWLWANDANLMDDKLEKCTMDSQEAVETLQFLADLRLKYKVAPKSTSTERNEGLNAFARGNVGMYMSGPWDIQTLDEAENLKWDVAPMPTKKTKATMLGTENYGIYAQTKYPKEAWALFNYLLSAKSQAAMSDQLGKMPSRVSVLQGAYAKGKVNYNRQVYVDAVEYAQQPPNIPEYSQVQDILQAELDRIWIGAVSVKDGLRVATDKVNKKLAELRGGKG